jgi:peptidoglycan biosynthesis protein MviN/MurJ (putative lipid II flippase)
LVAVGIFEISVSVILFSTFSKKYAYASADPSVSEKTQNTGWA